MILMFIGIVIGLVLGFLLGFCVGARARQLVASVRMVPTALRSLIRSLAPAQEDDKENESGQADDALDSELPDDVELDFNSLLNSDLVPGIDDHPEIEFNPVIAYQIKVSTDAARKEKQRAQLIADGFDPDEMDDVAQEAAGTGVKPNALAVLEANGARLTSMASSQSSDTMAREDRRRQLRTIDAYLAKEYNVDVVRVPAKKGTSESGHGTGQKKQNAFDVARLSNVPFAFDAIKSKFHHGTAKSARVQLRAIQRVRPIVFRSSDEDADGRRKGQVLSADAQAEMLQELQAEVNAVTHADQIALEHLLNDDEEGEEDEEGEGEDAEEVDEEKLTA